MVRTHYTETRTRDLFVSTIFALLTLIAFVVSIQSRGNSIVSILTCAFGVLPLVTALIFFTGSRSRIVTSPRGLEYHTVGFSISTTWDNIERIDQIPIFQDVRPLLERVFSKGERIGYTGHLDGLVLREPVNIQTRFYERTPPGPQKQIILSIEFKRWRESGLAQDLRQYAPHLFVQDSMQSE